MRAESTFHRGRRGRGARASAASSAASAGGVGIGVVAGLLLSGYDALRPQAAPPVQVTPPVKAGNAFATADTATSAAVVVGMTNRLTFTPESVVIEVGQAVRWENTSMLVHTVTADPERATLEGSAHLAQRVQ